MISSHEMEALNPTSPKDRMKQLVVISLLGMAFLSFNLYDAGLFNPIEITEDVIDLSSSPFIYKTVARDYLTSAGSMRQISDDLLQQDYEFTKNQIYTIFLDNTKGLIPTSYKRSIVGTIVANDNNKMTLLSRNKDDNVGTNVYSEYTNEDDDSNGKDGRSKRFWDSLNYDVGILPLKTKALKVQFRFTNGFLSSFIHFYKVLPEITQFMKEKGILEPIFIYTCNTDEAICTFYSPLENINQFHLNALDTKQYARKLIQENKMEGKDESTTSTEEESNKEAEL